MLARVDLPGAVRPHEGVDLARAIQSGTRRGGSRRGTLQRGGVEVDDLEQRCGCRPWPQCICTTRVVEIACCGILGW